MKTVVIYHRADFDGLFCREIAKHFLGEADVAYVGWDYGDALVQWPADVEVVYVLDLSPECLVRDWSERATNLIWIDHHATAIAKWPTSLPGVRVDGVAACRLTWNYMTSRAHDKKVDFVERNVREPWAVRLAGEYDVWDKRDPDAELFQHGLRSRELTADYWIGMLMDLPGYVGALLDAGRAVQFAQQQADAGTVKHRSFRARFAGLQFLCLNTARCNSLTFKAEERTEDEGLLGFYWNGQKWKVSLYGAGSHPGFDLSAIAVTYGGGGHKQACGFEYAGDFLSLLKPVTKGEV